MKYFGRLIIVMLVPVLSACGVVGALMFNSDDSVTGQGNADVVNVRAVESANGSWTFHVSVAHPDTGWEDYADGWDVVTSDGTVLKPDPNSPFTRLLLHPHETEQPFTRSQSNIVIPDGMTTVQCSRP